ncbi:MAG: flippase-like domain-containing protein [Myxococcales bacterium]|nr:flippase-like domain-containing protein [Myxococcales bacterium]
MPPQRRRILRALKGLVSFGLLGLLFALIARREGLDALLERVEGADPAFWLVAVMLQLGAVGAGIWRWKLLLGEAGGGLGTSWLGKHYLIGRFLGVFTPSTAGLDVYRVLAVSRRLGSATAATYAVVIEKLFGLIGLSLLIGASAMVGLLVPLQGAEGLGDGALGAALLLGLASMAALALLLHGRGATRLLGLLPGSLRGRLARPLEALAAQRPAAGRIAQVLALSTSSHLLTAAVFVATSRALGIELGALELLICGLAIVIATLLPLSIGGLGVREGAAVVLLGALGVPALDATLVALLGYLSAQPPALLGGLLSLLPAPRESAAAPAGSAAGLDEGLFIAEGPLLGARQR